MPPWISQTIRSPAFDWRMTVDFLAVPNNFPDELAEIRNSQNFSIRFDLTLRKIILMG